MGQSRVPCSERLASEGTKVRLLTAPQKAVKRLWMGEGPRGLGQCLRIVVPNPCVQLTRLGLLKMRNRDCAQDPLN